MPEIIQEQGVQDAPLSRYCRRCHRRLKNPKWQKVGYGPVCAGKVRQEGA